MANSSTAPLQTRNVAVLLGTSPHPRRLHLALRSDPDTFYLGVSDEHILLALNYYSLYAMFNL